MPRAVAIVAALIVAACADTDGPEHAWSPAALVGIAQGAGTAPPRVAGDGNRALLSWWDQHPESPMAVAWYRDRAWTIQRPLAWLTPPLSFNGLALAEDGRAVITWDGFSRAQATSFSTDTGWSDPIQAPRERYGVQWYRYAADERARGLAVWVEVDKILSAWFDGAAWTTPTSLGYGARPEVAISGDGNSAVAVWSDDGTMTARRWSAGAWQPAAEISNPGSATGNPIIRVAVDIHGHATVAWTQSFDDAGVYANHFVPSSGWSGAKPVGVFRAADQLALAAANGAAALVMSLTNGDLWHARLASGAWSTPTHVAGETSRAARVVIDDRGRSVVAWATFAPHWGVFARTCDPSGCGENLRLDRGNVDWLTAPVLSMSPSGSVIAAWWRHNEGTTSVWVSHGEPPR